MRRVTGDGDSCAAGHGIGGEMAKKLENLGNEEEKEQGEKKAAQEGTPAGKPPSKKKMSPRARVKKAQMTVLDKLDDIITSNCSSASKGNYKCAEFVLDWSGATDIRTPLSIRKKKSMVAALLKRAEERKEAEDAE